jgi:aryl-alcohol dehydrogenase-like predicted oxidoreductase
MPEAVFMPTQRIGDKLLPAIGAAGKLNIFPIASGSIGQGEALSLAEKLKPRPGSVLTHPAQRALQFTRSAPGLATALIGMKQPNHVQQNLELCKKPLLEPERFQALFRK